MPDLPEGDAMNLPNGWVETTLGEVTHYASGKMPITEVDLDNYVSTENLLADKMGVTQAATLPKIFKVNAFDAGDTLFSNIRTYFKKVWYSDKIGGSSNDVLVFRPTDKDQLDKKYLYYLISNDGFIDYTVITAKGTKMPRGDKDAIKQYPLFLPPLPEQKAIADMLSSFDDKIELLREQNKTLETLAQTIFKEWFVKFNAPQPPEGGEKIQPPEGGENNTASKGDGGKSPSGDLGAMVDSELGLIPKGWRVGKISDLGKIVCGKTPSKAKKEYFDGDVPFIKIPDMHNKMFIVETTDTLSQEGKASQALKTIPKDSVSVSCIATVGLVSISIKESQTNQQINTIIPKEENLREFIFLDMQKRKKYLMDIGSGGTATLNVNTRTFSNIEVMIPSEHVLADFSATVSPTFDKILENCLQIQTLSQTRDTLLPKLMSGKLRAES